MTTGCCEPRQAGESRHEGRDRKKARTVPAGCSAISPTSTTQTTGPPCTTGQGKDRAAPVSRQRPADREPPRTRRHRRTGQRTGRPPRGPGHPHNRTRERENISLDLYLVTVPYSAANPPSGPAVAGLFPSRGPLAAPDSRRTTPPRPATPPRIPFSASPRQIRAFCASDSRRGRRHSWRSKRPPRQTPRLSLQPAWQPRPPGIPPRRPATRATSEPACRGSPHPLIAPLTCCGRRRSRGPHMRRQRPVHADRPAVPPGSSEPRASARQTAHAAPPPSRRGCRLR